MKPADPFFHFVCKQHRNLCSEHRANPLFECEECEEKSRQIQQWLVENMGCEYDPVHNPSGRWRRAFKSIPTNLFRFMTKEDLTLFMLFWA